MTAKVIRFPMGRRALSVVGRFDWSEASDSRNPLDDIAEIARMDMQVVRGTVTDRQVEQLQDFARLKGRTVPRVKNGLFLGKTVLTTRYPAKNKGSRKGRS